MKKTEKDQARALRKEGKAINEIATALGVSKASISLWVRDIELSKEQRSKLTQRGFSVEAIEKRRINRIQKTTDRHKDISNNAKKDITVLSKHELLLIGTALYWGEGGKTEKGSVRVANSDPRLIQVMMRFFREVCEVSEEKFRGHVHTFSHLNAEAAEEYWSKVSGISRNKFYKTYSKPSSASLGKKDTLPYGTFQIYVGDIELFCKIQGWTEQMVDLVGEVTT